MPAPWTFTRHLDDAHFFLLNAERCLINARRLAPDDKSNKILSQLREHTKKVRKVIGTEANKTH